MFFKGKHIDIESYEAKMYNWIDGKKIKTRWNILYGTWNKEMEI